MSGKAWLNNYKHIHITGKSGAGKTTLAKQIAHMTNRDLVVVFNPFHRNKFFSRCRVKAHNMVKSIKRGKRQIEVMASTSTRDDFKLIYETLRKISENMDDLTVMLVVDEAHRLAKPRGSISKEPLTVALKEGRNHDIKIVSLSQGPRDIHSVVTRESAYLAWVGSYDVQSQDYYKRHNIPYQKLPKAPDDPDDTCHITTLFGPNFQVISKFRASTRYSP